MVVIKSIFLPSAFFGADQHFLFLIIGHGKPSPDLFHTAMASDTDFLLIKGTNVNTGVFYGGFTVFQHSGKMDGLTAGFFGTAKVGIFPYFVWCKTDNPLLTEPNQISPLSAFKMAVVQLAASPLAAV